MRGHNVEMRAFSMVLVSMECCVCVCLYIRCVFYYGILSGIIGLFIKFFLCFFNRVLMCCLMVIGCWLGFATSMLNVH